MRIENARLRRAFLRNPRDLGRGDFKEGVLRTCGGHSLTSAISILAECSTVKLK